MIADVLAIVDLGSTDASFLNLAQHFAEVQKARLRIAVAAPVHSMEFSLATAGGYPLMNALADSAQAKATLLKSHEKPACDVDIDCCVGEIEPLTSSLALAAGTSDVVLIGPPSAYGDPGFRRRAIERLALLSGRPVLTVPSAATIGRIDHIVLGWKATREAVRALNDVLPLLQPGATVDVAAAASNGGEDLAPVCDHLGRLGFDAHPHHLGGKGTAGDQLIGFAASKGAQLLAIGAYGHSRFQEVVLGGVTRELIGGAAGAVLFAH